jgi:hypothetical protein
MSNIPKDKMISLSSWNYGSYSITNPYYNKMNLKSPPIKIYQSEYLINCNNNNQKNEKIVKKIYFENLDYMKYISRDDKDKNIQRPKSAKNNIRNNNNNNTNKNANTNYELRVRYDKWLWNKIKEISKEKLKKKDLEKKNLEEEEQKKVIAKNGISYKTWFKKKMKELNIEKEQKLKIEEEKRLKKEEDDKVRREKMDEWMNEKKNIEIEKNKKIKMEKMKQKQLEKKNKKLKDENNKKNFEEWLTNKSKEKKVKSEDKKSFKYIKRKHSEVIGPYSNANILRQMQKMYNEKENEVK